ncbi:MAG: serine/threonine protein kinase [Myxococcales bacterium]|nr:serine/threonine protein kinase [Myxococcales bacterium]
MTANNALGATKKGFTQAPSSGIQRLLSATQRGLGMKVSGRVAEPVEPEAPKVERAEPAKQAVALSPLASKVALDSVKVAFATGLYKTKAGVLGKRLLDEHGPALRAYLTVQLRSSKAASEALIALEDALEHGSAEQFKKGPSQRAALFLAARNHVETERLLGDVMLASMNTVPWEPTPPGKVEGWGRALDEMRFGLGERENELLMLRHACHLNDTEVAYVIGGDKAEVQRTLEAAVGFAKLLLEDVFESTEIPKLADVLADAFRVMPPTPEELAAAAKPQVVPLPEGTLIGNRYELAEKLGGGEFAYVYKARDVRVPGHTVALKLLHRVARTHAAREGAIRELSLIASAFHPSLVQFKDHGWFEDRLWFVMPFYEGQLLLERLGEGPLDLDDGLAHFERLARGLAALHGAGIRHQDIKPENIFLVQMQNETLPILLDLGVAAPSGEMALAGTPMYFPPEVAGRIFDESHTAPLTPKADVFALALSFLHSIEEPDLSEIEGVEVDEFLRRRVEASPAGPRAPENAFLAPHFERWISKDPAARPTAAELADEIAEIRAERRGQPTTTKRTVAVPAGLKTALTLFALMALLLLAALVSDTPARTIQIVQGAPTEAAAAVVEPTNESDRVRLLRDRLDTEERRVLELEEELTNLRRRQLGLAPRGR